MTPIPSNRQVETAQQIDALLDSHRRWVDRLNKTLICGVPPAEDIVAEDAHMQCALGSYLESGAQSLFQDQEAFSAIYRLHEKVHGLGRSMALEVQSSRTVDVSVYEDFLAAISELQSKITQAYDTVVDIINTTDPLTGAQNRSQMPNLLEERIRETVDGTKSWVLMVDLDRFKSVNDRYGHEVGDRVLKGFAAVVRDHIRTNDLFFRYGGEEFLICVSGVTQTTISKVAERLRVAVSAERFEAPNGETISVTASFGIVQLAPDIAPEDAINAADTAMYTAKHLGRNKVVFHGEMSGRLNS